MTSLSLTATLRLQFHSGFTLDDAIPLIPYFQRLGISHLYASPLLAATPGSTHGYDTIDCHHIDPDRGGIDGLRRLVAALRAQDMGLILDIVPNHMGVSAKNIWWMDVLRHGRKSAYAQHFDIDWTPSEPGLHNKVLLPFLGAPLNDILETGDLKLAIQAETNHLVLSYGDQIFPLSPESEASLLAASQSTDEQGESLLTRLNAFLDPHSKPGRARLQSLLDAQHYRLAWWRVAGDLVNWRRFFDITSLIALRMDRRDVFEDTHKLVFDLYRTGLIDGLRIDHVDGLARPAEYCTRLRAKLDALRHERPQNLREQAPFFVEKILQKNEILPLEWPVTGTTGYDFLEQVDLLLHDPRGEEPLTALWAELGHGDFKIIEHTAREEKLDTAFAGDFERLVELLLGQFPAGRDLTRHALGTAMRALLVAFPVYRSYFADGGDSGADFRAIDRARLAARPLLPVYLHNTLDLICQYLADARIDTTERQEVLERFEHLTAPLTAKAGEDTAFYRYTRLLSRNDVGCNPGRFAAPVSQFHTMNMERLTSHPRALLTTATHDHKRGEDGRARLMVLSEPAAAWPDTVRRWLAQTADNRTETAHGPSPVAADAYFIFQTLISSWPLEPSGFDDYTERLDAYLTKALREAGEHTGWSDPDESYEKACLDFARSCVLGPLRETLASYVGRIGKAAALNSLSQTLLRMTSPGIPDLYQGRENWDFSLVDPDNRRPVDYPQHERLMAEGASFIESCATWKTGRVKQALIETLLSLRRAYPELFETGRYLPLIATGPMAPHIVTFQRQTLEKSCLIIAPRLTLDLSPDEGLCQHNRDWSNTTLPVQGAWESLLYEGDIHKRGLFSLDYLNGRPPIDILISTN